MPDLPVKLALPIMVILNGFLIVCGNPSSDFVCYKFSKEGTWDVYTSSPKDHTDQPGVVLNNKLYVYSDRVPEIFDPMIPKWSNWEKSTARVGTRGCMTVANGKIYLIGGELSNLVQAFDPNVDQGKGWTKVADLPALSHNIGCSIMGDPTKIMMTITSSKNNVVIFDTSVTKDQFTNVKIEADVFGSNIILIGSDNYLVAGGDPGSNTIYKYTPHLTPYWTKYTKEVLHYSRHSAGAVVVNASIFADGFLPNTCTGL